MKGKRITKNIIISISVQIISLLVSFILSFLVPKFVSEYQYSYWQMYVLYASYVGVLHFGLLDGIVLRYSQFDYENLDKARIRSQFQILLFSTAVISIGILAVAAVHFGGITKTIMMLVAISVVTKNLITYNSYSFQITNRINEYAVLIVAQRMSYGLLAVLLLLFGVDRFEWYCVADLTGDLVGILLAQFFNKGMYFGKAIPFKDALSEWKVNVSSGIILMMANWSSMLLVGGAKMIVQWRWDELTFGKISFSFSISNLFLTFVTAISVVLFPSLKRMEQDQLPPLYNNIRNIMSPVLFGALFCYFPGCLILKRFIPAYSESLIYLGTLLPIIVYTSKVTLLTNNYLKAYRKEKSMFYINAASVTVAFVLFFISAYVLNRLNAILVCIVIATMINSMLSETAVAKVIHIKLRREFVIEAAMTAGFIVSTSCLRFGVAWVVYTAMLALYFLYKRKNIMQLVQKLRGNGGRI